MIAKGIKNATTGEVTQIEGAGYVYNEEKNSVAFGSGTIASGQDQFVFGRYNEEDADKAEIVGVGVRGDSREITDSSEILSYLTGLAIGSQVTITPNTWTGGGSMKVLKAGNSISEAIAYIKSLFEDSPFSTYTIVSGGQYSEEDVCSVFAPLNIREEYSGHGLWAVSDVFVNGVLFLTNNGKILKCTHSESSKYWIKASDFYATTPTKVTTVESITPANIRTLDWDGNEYLAGSLAIGEDSVAGTKGQLVFGRGNVADTNKAEIVGGGNNNAEYVKGERATVALTDTTPNNPVKKNISVEYFGDESYFIANYDFASDTRVTDSASIISALQAESSNYHVWKVLNDTSELFFLTNTNALPKAVTINVDKSWTIREDQYGVVTMNHWYIVSSEKQARKNIRTLAWDGTQWNAGDVTCDDVLGNTISLRETHANVTETTTLIRKALLSEGGVVNEPINLNEYNNSNCFHYAVSVNGAESVAISDMFYTDNSDYSIVIFKNISSVNSGQTIFVEVFKADNKYILRVADVYQTPSGPTPH